MRLQDKIEVEDVRFAYRAEPVLSGFCASFGRGEVVALTGRNGCGKTTLTRLIVGMLRPQAGRIRISGQDNADMDLFEIGRRVGYMFQNPACQLFCQTVFDEVAYGLRRMGLAEEAVGERVSALLDRFGLQEERASYPLSLSGGQRRRLALCAVLALGTAFIVLDEPTTGLDLPGRTQLGGDLRHLAEQNGCGIVLVSHERDFIRRYTDREVEMP